MSPAAVLDEHELTTALKALPGWSSDGESLQASYAGPSVAVALGFLAAVGAAAEVLNHHPDVDWRYRSVHVRTTTHSAGNRVTAKDVGLAHKIAALAEALGLTASADQAACSCSGPD